MGKDGERTRDGLNLRKPRNIVSDLWPGEDRPTRYSSHDESATTTFISCAHARARDWPVLIAKIGLTLRGYRLAVSGEAMNRLSFNVVRASSASGVLSVFRKMKSLDNVTEIISL